MLCRFEAWYSAASQVVSRKTKPNRNILYSSILAYNIINLSFWQNMWKTARKKWVNIHMRVNTSILSQGFCYFLGEKQHQNKGSLCNIAISAVTIYVPVSTNVPTSSICRRQGCNLGLGSAASLPCCHIMRAD